MDGRGYLDAVGQIAGDDCVIRSFDKVYAPNRVIAHLGIGDSRRMTSCILNRLWCNGLIHRFDIGYGFPAILLNFIGFSTGSTRQ